MEICLFCNKEYNDKFSPIFDVEICEPCYIHEYMNTCFYCKKKFNHDFYPIQNVDICKPCYKKSKKEKFKNFLRCSKCNGKFTELIDGVCYPCDHFN